MDAVTIELLNSRAARLSVSRGELVLLKLRPTIYEVLGSTVSDKFEPEVAREPTRLARRSNFYLSMYLTRNDSADVVRQGRCSMTVTALEGSCLPDYGADRARRGLESWELTLSVRPFVLGCWG